jgi:hypothetical protein
MLALLKIILQNTIDDLPVIRRAWIPHVPAGEILPIKELFEIFLVIGGE